MMQLMACARAGFWGITRPQLDDFDNVLGPGCARQRAGVFVCVGYGFEVGQTRNFANDFNARSYVGWAVQAFDFVALLAAPTGCHLSQNGNLASHWKQGGFAGSVS
ncbi:MAG: hypothetical protein KI788_08205, partial [Mameliella sp.]|nr:hypothetical protein [Mameliella sp.]